MNKVNQYIVMGGLLVVGALALSLSVANAKITGLGYSDTVVKVPTSYSEQSNKCYPNAVPGETLKDKVDEVMKLLDANEEHSIKITYRVDMGDTISLGGYNIEKDMFIDSIYMMDKVCFLWSTKPAGKGV